MSKRTYVLVPSEHNELTICPSDSELDDTSEGMTWRDAKKELRSFYLEKAAALRQLTEREFLKQHYGN